MINLLTSGMPPKELAVYLAGGNVTVLRRYSSNCSFVPPCRKVPFVLPPKERLHHSLSFTSMVGLPPWSWKNYSWLEDLCGEHWLEEDLYEECVQPGFLPRSPLRVVCWAFPRTPALDQLLLWATSLISGAPWVVWPQSQGFSKGTPSALYYFLIHVTSISKDKTCSSNFFMHGTWMMVSSRQSLCQALNLLQVHGPALGLYINLRHYLPQPWRVPFWDESLWQAKHWNS